jgi:hypothetical protein
LKDGNGINPGVLEWLLETRDPAVKYLASRDLTSCNVDELILLRQKAHASGPIPFILDKMNPAGFWVEPGAGYYPKYTGTVWSLMLLSQLGASLEMDARIAKACSYFISQSLTKFGHFSVNGQPSGSADCLQGNMCGALLDLGCWNAGMESAFDYMARSVTGEGIAPVMEKNAPLRYYAGKCGPNFACGSNNKLPCAWGAVKVMLAFSKLPENKRTPVIDRAISQGSNFLLSRDPADADYPCGYSTKPSTSWGKLGFPIFYITDFMQNVEALVKLGYGRDLRLAKALQLIRSKASPAGRWNLEYDYSGKTWIDFGPKKEPNKWVTLRAMRILKQ